MISEELVASSGTQVHEADIQERSSKATAAQESRVSVVPCGSLGSEDLPWPLLPREAAGKRGPGNKPKRQLLIPKLVPSA